MPKILDVIPTPVITHFVRDYELNKRYTGFPALGCDFRKLENADLKRSKKVPKAKAAFCYENWSQSQILQNLD